MTDEPSHQLVRVAAATDIPSAQDINLLGTVAENLAKSGMFPDARTASQAFAKIMLGRSLGLGPMQAMTGIHIVEGKPQLAATTLAGFVRQHPDYDYQVAQHDDKTCEIFFYGADSRELGTSSFTLDEAKQAGLVKPKSAWEKYPKNMLFARAMSNGVRWYCPDLFGGVPVYTEADEFEVRPALTQGRGDGEPVGIELPAAVEAIIARATELGHQGLADRAAAEMAIGGMPVKMVAVWVATAEAELDAIEQAAVDAEVEEPAK
jgi:hypothetical protein